MDSFGSLGAFFVGLMIFGFVGAVVEGRGVVWGCFFCWGRGVLWAREGICVNVKKLAIKK